MMLKYKLIALLLTVCIYSYSQSKYDEMKNAFLLGLREDGLRICLELISKQEYSEYKEETIFYISEQFFYEYLIDASAPIDKLNQSYTFYERYRRDYPSGRYSDIVNSRLNYIVSTNSTMLSFGLLNDINQNERNIVQKMFDYYGAFAEIKSPAWYEFYFEGSRYQSIDVIKNYYESIAKNHPNYSIFALNHLFLISINQLYGNNLVIPKLLKYDRNSILDDKGKKRVAIEADSVLQRMVNISPHHHLTLDAHLILALINLKHFKGNFWGTVVSNRVLTLLNYVLENEGDKLSPRYILTKEFILNNKFE